MALLKSSSIVPEWGILFVLFVLPYVRTQTTLEVATDEMVTTEVKDVTTLIQLITNGGTEDVTNIPTTVDHTTSVDSGASTLGPSVTTSAQTDQTTSLTTTETVGTNNVVTITSSVTGDGTNSLKTSMPTSVISTTDLDTNGVTHTAEKSTSLNTDDGNSVSTVSHGSGTTNDGSTTTAGDVTSSTSSEDATSTEERTTEGVTSAASQGDATSIDASTTVGVTSTASSGDHTTHVVTNKRITTRGGTDDQTTQSNVMTTDKNPTIDPSISTESSEVTKTSKGVSTSFVTAIEEDTTVTEQQTTLTVTEKNQSAQPTEPPVSPSGESTASKEPTEPNPSGDPKVLTGGQIAGIVIGSVAGAALIVGGSVGGYIYLSKSRSMRTVTPAGGDTQELKTYSNQDEEALIDGKQSPPPVEEAHVNDSVGDGE